MLQSYGRGILQDAMEVADRLQLRLFATSGTLLGMHRERGFIPHDGDLDLGMLEDDLPRRSALVDALAARGYRVVADRPDELSVLSYAKGGVNLDIFTFYRQGAVLAYRAVATTGKILEYHVPVDTTLPLKRGSFLGIEVWQPAHPRRWLAEHYGADWRVPRPRWSYETDATNLQ